jgi:hypothetical protein
MPFGMGPAGLFMWPYMAQWMQNAYPWYAGYPPYYGYGAFYPYAQPTKEQEVDMLEDQAKALEEELARIRSRIDELQKGTSGQ